MRLRRTKNFKDKKLSYLSEPLPRLCRERNSYNQSLSEITVYSSATFYASQNSGKC